MPMSDLFGVGGLKMLGHPPPSQKQRRAENAGLYTRHTPCSASRWRWLGLGPGGLSRK
jgi:hypothetical protein